MESKSDFLVINGGSVLMIMPQTDQAKDWTADNIHLADWQNSERIACEPRYFADIAEGIAGAGLTIEEI